MPLSSIPPRLTIVAVVPLDPCMVRRRAWIQGDEELAMPHQSLCRPACHAVAAVEPPDDRFPACTPVVCLQGTIDWPV